MGSFIKIDRKILEWEWYKNEHTKNLFFHCLLKAYWKDVKREGKIIPRGSFVTSIKKLSEELDLTEDEIKTALKHLIKTGELTKQTTNKNTVITVSNYNLYQEDTKQLPNNYQPIPNQLPTNKEDKEEEEYNNLSCAPKPHDDNLQEKEEKLRHDFEIIYALYPKKRGKTVAFANYKQWVSDKGKDVGGKRYRLTNRQIYLAVKKYVKQQEEAGQDDYQYWKNFDTLMGRQLLDYVEWEDDKK